MGVVEAHGISFNCCTNVMETAGAAADKECTAIKENVVACKDLSDEDDDDLQRLRTGETRLKNTRSAGANKNFSPDTIVAAFAASRGFEYLTLFVIFVNAIWMGIDTDLNNAKSRNTTDTIWIIGDNFFCTFFTVEILIRLVAFEDKSACLRDGWFIFDSLLVILMVLETWIMVLVLDGSSGSSLDDLGFLRLLRLLRLARLTRLMRSFPELLILVKGVWFASRSVTSVLLLLGIIDYVFAILFTSTYKREQGQIYTEKQEELQTFFGNLGMSMFTLVCQGILLDTLDDLIRLLREDSVIMLLLFFLFILLSSFTLLNMLIGILCDIVADTEEQEKESMKLDKVRDVIINSYYICGSDGSEFVTLEQFDEMCQDHEFRTTLEVHLGIDACRLLEVRQLLFTNHEGVRELSFHDFLLLLTRLRPEEKAGPIDVQEFRRSLKDHEQSLLKRARQLQLQAMQTFERLFGNRSKAMARPGTSSSPSGECKPMTPRDISTAGSSRSNWTSSPFMFPQLREASDQELLEELRLRMQMHDPGMRPAPNFELPGSVTNPQCAD